MNKTHSIVMPVTVMLAILAVLLVFMCLPLGQTDANGAGGVTDLRSVDMGGSVYQLTGQWQYTPGQLYAPEDLPADAPVISLPEAWGFGKDNLNNCATYRLTILTDDSRQLQMYIPEIYTSYALWINGEYIRGAGVVSDNPASGVPAFAISMIPVKALDGKIEIVIQASNYHWMRPHMNNVLKLSESDNMYTWLFRTRILYCLALGFIISAAFYHFALFIMRRKMTMYFIFSLLCLITFIRFTMETDGIFSLLGWYLTVPGEIAGRIYLVTYFLHAAFSGVFGVYVFNVEFSTKYFKQILGYCVLGGLLFAIMPMNTMWLPFLFIITGTAPMVLALIVALKSRALREDKIMWLYVAAIMLYITVGVSSKYFANHLLYMTGVLNNIYMIMAQSVILARQFILSREAEASLEEKNAVLDSLNRMKSDFLANISHEISTPLTVISGYAEQTQMEIESGEVNEETAVNLHIVQSEAHRLASLAHQVLYTAKNLQTGVAIVPVRTAEILKRAAALCEPILAKNGNRLETRNDPDCPAVAANLDMILQVLLNLCANSNRHTKNGTVSVSVKRAGDFAEFTVEDNGSGVAPGLLSDVFMRGVSGDDKSGLGLAICKDVLRQHGGAIDIYNKQSGGACAVFTLPLVKEGE